MTITSHIYLFFLWRHLGSILLADFNYAIQSYQQQLPCFTLDPYNLSDNWKTVPFHQPL